MNDHEKTKKQLIEERYRMLTESTTDMIYITNRSGDVLYANRSAAENMRCDASRIVGRRQEELFPSEKVQKHIDSILSVFQTGEVYEADGMYRFGPEEIWLNTRLMPLRDERGEVAAVMGVSRNITDRKRAEAALKQARDELERRVEERTAELAETNKALRQSHDELQAIYDGMLEGLLIADSETRQLVRANSSICRMLGYSESELLSLSVADIHPKETLSSDLETFQAEAEGRIHLKENSLLLRKDGSILYADIVSHTLVYGGRPCVVGFFHNTTERKQAEEALAESEAKYRGLMDICPDSILVLDMTGKTQFVSKQTWELLKLSEQEDLVGKNSFDYVIEADRPRLASNLAELIRVGRRGPTEYTVLRPDGTTVPVELLSAMISDAQGNPMSIMTITRDISERKQAEETLRQHYQELRAIYDGMADALVILDIETNNCLRVNRSMCKLLGYAEEELKVLPIAKLHPPERVTELLNRHQELAEGRLSHSEDLPFLRKDGSIVYVDIISDRITYNGRPCLIHLLRDTTERRQAQKALKKEHRALKHLLQSSDHERQLIAYEIHDGLAQQLAGAIMQLETFSYQRDNQPKEAAKAYDAAITMLRQAHFETRRLISGVRPPILDESGIVAAVAHLVNEHRLQNGPIIEFRGDVSFDRLVPILENAIYRIVQEGLANTCKHSKSPKVRVELVQHEDVLRIKVEDWGIGFDPANVKEDRFGLEGIRERARLLGGSTTVKSTPRQGTCLTVELPLVFREK